MGLDFLKRYGAKRTTGNENPANPFSMILSEQLIVFLFDYELMAATGKNPLGEPLPIAQINVIRGEVKKMRAELASRNLEPPAFDLELYEAVKGTLTERQLTEQEAREEWDKIALSWCRKYSGEFVDEMVRR